MAVRFGLLVTLEAREGQSQALAAFLQQGRAIAAEESGTVTWYAFQVDETTFGVFDTFETVEGRQEHLSGRIPRRSGRSAPTCWPGSRRSGRSTSSPPSDRDAYEETVRAGRSGELAALAGLVDPSQRNGVAHEPGNSRRHDRSPRGGSS